MKDHIKTLVFVTYHVVLVGFCHYHIGNKSRWKPRNTMSPRHFVQKIIAITLKNHRISLLYILITAKLDRISMANPCGTICIQRPLSLSLHEGVIGSRFIVTFIGSGPVIYVYFIAARYLCLYPRGGIGVSRFSWGFFFGWGENGPINVMRNVRSERDG